VAQDPLSRLDEGLRVTGPANREKRAPPGITDRLSKVDPYDSEMTFEGDTVDGDQAIVRTTLILSKGAEMSLSYRMHQMRDRWQVYDLDVARISLGANYGEQFSKIIRTASYEALVARLTLQRTDLSARSVISSGTAERRRARRSCPGSSAPGPRKRRPRAPTYLLRELAPGD
jgi:hypothetical protein